LHQLLQDLRFSLRMLRRNPLFTTIAVLALGLGIGASTGLFSLMDTVLLRPLPGIAKPHELVTFERWQAGQLLGDMGYPDFRDYAARLRGLSGLAVEAGARLSFAQGGRVERVGGALVSSNFFSLLGVKPAVGRLLMPDDDREDREPVAVLSSAFWERAFGRDAGIVGSRLTLNGHSFTVVGVAQESFRGTDLQFQPDLWLPITTVPVAMPRLSAGVLGNRASGWLRILGRLKPGTSLPTAQAEVTQVAAQLAAEYPLTNHARTVTLIEGLGMWSDDREELRRFLGLLLVSVGLLQLLACANVANLLLARGAARQREIAVRLALGANRGQLTRLFLMEGSLLAALAAILGVLLSPGLAQLAVALPQPAYALREAHLQVDWRIATFAVLAGVCSGVLIGCIPAWKASRTDLLTPLRAGSPGAGRSKSRLRGGLVAAQIALSMMLLAAAGTAVQTMERGLMANPIARPGEVLLCSLDLTTQGYSAESGGRFYESLLDHLRALPGVTAVSLGSSVPPEEISGRISIFYPGQEPAAEVLAGREFELGLRVDDDTVGPRFFRTLGIGLLEGREFGAQDRADSLPVAVVNAGLAKRMWPGKDPIGQRISLGPAHPPMTVVGVVTDVASRSLLGSTPPHLYFPYSQAYDGRAKIVVRGMVPHSQLATSLREAVAQLDPRLPLYAFQTMPEHIANTLWRQRIAAMILGAFGLLALVLASIGLYGVVAHSVSQRNREIGIRMAVGAGGARVCALIVQQALRWVGAGAAAGLPLAVWATWAMQKGIPGIRPHDPFALGTTLLVLGAVSFLASLIPALRAVKVNPVVALRQE
jgi:predicted permease